MVKQEIRVTRTVGKINSQIKVDSSLVDIYHDDEDNISMVRRRSGPRLPSSVFWGIFNSGKISEPITITTTSPQLIIPRPTGGINETGSIASLVGYQTVASHVVADKLQFQVAKIVISSEKAVWFKLRWNAVDISCERVMDSKTIVIEHFPWDYFIMLGDGVQAFDVQARWFTAAGTVNAEIVGEEY